MLQVNTDAPPITGERGVGAAVGVGRFGRLPFLFIPLSLLEEQSFLQQLHVSSKMHTQRLCRSTKMSCRSILVTFGYHMYSHQLLGIMGAL